MKISALNEKLSVKSTVIAISAVILFLIAGIIASVLGGITFYNSKEAKIINYSVSPQDAFHLRKDGTTLVYKYQNGTENVDVDKIIKLSKNASYKILAAYDGNNNQLNNTSSVLNTAENQRYFLLINVSSEYGFVQNGYLLEIVNIENYSDESPQLTEIGNGITIS